MLPRFPKFRNLGKKPKKWHPSSRSQNQRRHSKFTLLERIPLKIPNQNMPKP